MSTHTIPRPMPKPDDDSPLRGAKKDAEAALHSALRFAVGNDLEAIRLLFAQIALSMSVEQLEELYAQDWFGDLYNVHVKPRPVGHDMEDWCDACDSVAHDFGCVLAAMKKALAREFGGVE